MRMTCLAADDAGWHEQNAATARSARGYRGTSVSD